MKALKLILLITLLGGCTPSSSLMEIHQRVAQEVKLLIDSGCINTQYVEIYELVSNDSNNIYSITISDSPGSSNAEYPSRVIKYKDKFLCFIELDEPEMTTEQLIDDGIVRDSTSSILNQASYMRYNTWFLGISKYKENKVLIKDSVNSYLYFYYPELWPYLSGENPQNKNAIMIIGQHDIVVSEATILEPYRSSLNSPGIDSVRFYAQNFRGEIAVRNPTDSILTLSYNPNPQKMYGVVNGIDTLRFFLGEELPLQINPKEDRILHYESEPTAFFFDKLPEERSWMSMYKLLSDSTFCFLYINGKPSNFRLLHINMNRIDYVTKERTSEWYPFYNEGVFNKQEREYNFFGRKD